MQLTTLHNRIWANVYIKVKMGIDMVGQFVAL